MPVWLVLLVTAAYMAALFALAARSDRRAAEAGPSPRPLVYALALGVYCTSWTYFGAVGTAVASGWEYLPIYLGPIFVFLFLPRLIARIAEIVRRESISSLSDFLSARYGKSRAVGAAAALAAVMGGLPYIALQLKSVGMSLEAVAGEAGAPASPANETVLLTALALAAFSVLYGTRHSDATRANYGLMQVLAIEAVVKLVALCAVALLAIALIAGGAAPLTPEITATFAPIVPSERFITILILSMAAIICLPHEFHVAMIERRSPADLPTARWLFPAYLAATSLVIVPITLAGLSLVGASQPADLYVLALPAIAGHDLLTLVVFLGGFSAATGMVVVSTIALSNMVTNDLVVPAMMRTGAFARLTGNAGARLLLLRRLMILALLLLAYSYYRLSGGSAALAQIGLLAFVAAAQFAPALIAAVYWRGARRAGVLAGLIGGTLVWAYTLFLPSILGREAMAAAVPPLLDPHALFGVSPGDSLTHGTLWSLGINLLLLIAVSLHAGERLRDRVQAAVFVDAPPPDTAPGAGQGASVRGVSPNGLKTLAGRFLQPDAVQHAFEDFERQTGIPASGDEPADWRLVARTERLLASALGASSARVVLASAIGGANVALPDVLAMLDARTQAERFERHMLQSMLENISQGISVIDEKQRLVAWNSAYVELFGYPSDLVAVGTPIERLIAHNAASGWITSDAAEAIQRRIGHMKAGRPHTHERRFPDGRYFRITGNPMPGGGYVTTFTDITADKAREAALLDANERLESRVRERTAALERLTEDLLRARQEAEGANASKTRFLAAASHDLLQPLNAARLFLGSALTSTDLPATLGKADRAIQSADELLRGLLDISRLDQGHITPNPQRLPLGPLLEDLIDEAAPMAERAGIALDLVPTRLAVEADPEFLKSILRNFISNARRYTRSGRVLVGARRRGSNVRIEVWDTGPGIPVERRQRVFEEFQRFETTDNAGQRGAGLGLAVVRRLADIMGARIDLRSEVGKGSVFSVTVPRAAALQLAAPSHRALPVPGSLQGLRVLVLDDEPSILDAMRALLGGWGCEVHLAGTAEAARSAAEGGLAAIIADLDLRTPDTDGLNVIKSLQGALVDPANAVLLTANATEPVREAAAACGIGVMRKPVDPADLRDFLGACAARAHVQAAE